MPDLFSTSTPKPIGHGNAAFLADIADRLPLATLQANRKAGKYDPLWKGAKGWLKLAGYRV